MKRLKIKELSLRFKTNLLIAKIKEQIKLKQIVKGHNVDGIFTGRNQRDDRILRGLTDSN